MLIKFICILVLLETLAYANKPELFLLKTYKVGQNISGMLMSEKLDGVRAFWDGRQLISRSGKIFHPPRWFTHNFPPFELDGELWTKRSDFESVVSIVNKKKPHEGWKNIRYKIFEVPHAKDGLLKRLEVIQKYLIDYPKTYIDVIRQTVCHSHKDLHSFSKRVQSLSGEGVVLRDAKALYHVKRSSKDLKVKPHFDAECKILGYKMGKGKFEGLMGALKCEMANNKSILIGTGFNLFLRKNPPKIGTVITFKYYGKTKFGLPRFPVYLRIRP